MSSTDLSELARQYATRAVEFDRNNEFQQAIFYYLEASQALINYKQLNEHNPQLNLISINSKLKEYISRAETLKLHINNHEKNSPQKGQAIKSEFMKDVEKGLCMLSEALDEDTDEKLSEAFDLYTETVDFYLKIKDKKNLCKTNEEAELFKKLEKNIKYALERAEKIKAILNNNENKLQKKSSPNSKSDPNNKIYDDLSKLTLDNLDELNDGFGDEKSPNLQQLHTGKASGFTKDEIDTLRHGSFINGRDYVPFFPEIDCKDKFFFPIPFSDKDGKLALSSSQRERFSKWVRPDEIFESPTLMMLVSSFSVKQTCISDCSFVSSLTVIAQYERKFNKNLLSKIIYPQNKKGEPVYNPCGKYMISLNLNGCSRKIIIDDYLPIDNFNNLLCSLTTNKGELWVSLLEKAYLKVMGGYDFPGSNSNIDLHALTSWIPERLAIHGEHTDFNSDLDFERMFDRLHKGDVLITIATGPMNKDAEERTGLVSTHAYAVLDIRKFKDQKLFQLKNPWSHLRWKGNFSEYDVTNWTEELKNALNYDPKLAYNFDNGIFWIDYESLKRFFDVFYLSWNPNLFPFTSCFHRKWSSSEGPVKDRYNLGDNPQYVIKIKPPSSSAAKKCTTWLLLTRHITDKADFAENKEYIALVVYKNNGQRIYYPMEPPPYKEGVRINSPHYLVKLVDDCTSPLMYTLVVSQYEKYNSIYFTLRAYCTMPFQMNELKEPYNPKYTKKLSGQWKGITAGGCSNNQDTYMKNPVYQIVLNNNDSSNYLKIELKGPQQYSVGFDLKCVSSNVADSPNNFKQTSSGDYRRGFCVLPIALAGGTYTIRPSTYLAGQEGPFILEIESNREFQLTQLQ